MLKTTKSAGSLYVNLLNVLTLEFTSSRSLLATYIGFVQKSHTS